MTKFKSVFGFVLIVSLWSPTSHADSRKQGSFVAQKPRTSITQPFGSGTITRRSDGSSSQTNKFGSGTIARERDNHGNTRSATTQPFASGTITRYSDGPSG